MAGTDLQGTGRKKLRWQLTLIILAMGVIKFITHMLISGNYELHRDAYLYLSYADHPQWGYMSNPPFIMVMSWLATKIFGGSAFAIRFFPALAGAISMVLLGRLTKELGGKKWAVIIATTAYLVAPIFLRSNSLFQPVAFDQMFWFLYLFLFVKLLQTQNKNYWFVLGIVAGVGFLTKYTIVVPVVLTIFFLIATRHKKLFLVPQFWGFLVNFGIIITPNLIWQHNHNWPELKHLQTLNETQLVNMNSGWFIVMQILILAPVLFIWIAGLYNLFASKDSRPYIVLGYSYVGMIIMMLLLQAKPYYPAPFYMILLVFGAIQWETWFEEKRTWVLGIVMALMIGSSIPLLPLSLPYLNMDKMLSFSETWQKRGFEAAFRWEDGKLHTLPQDYADMTGWRQTAQLTFNAWASLDSADRKHSYISGGSYGRTGAINYYNRRVPEIPKAFCFEGSFMFWTPVTLDSLQVLIYVGEPSEELQNYFGNVQLFAKVDDPHFREDGLPIYILRNPAAEMAKGYSELRASIIDPNHRKEHEHSDN